MTRINTSREAAAVSDIRITPGGTMEALGAGGKWQTVPKAAQEEIEELRRRLGGGCDANGGGDHTVITEGRYKFCGDCGESLTGVRYCHAPRESR